MTIYLRLWFVTSVSIRIDGPKCVFYHTERRSFKSAEFLFLFCSHEWRAWPQHRNVIDYTEIKMKETNMNEIYSVPWPFQCFTFDFFFILALHFPFFFFLRARTWLFFITPPFNCYYQINACNTRKLWNFLTKNVSLCCYTFHRPVDFH